MEDLLTPNECVVCGATEKLLRCSGCQEEYYCGRDHQKEHWKVHRSTCRLVRQRKTREKANGGSGGDKMEVDGANEYEFVLPMKGKKRKDGLVVGWCGMHAPDDFSFYMHALNNMAGSHKVDQPMKDGEENLQFNTVDGNWQVTETPHQIPNGLTLAPKTSYKRALGQLGHGILIQGNITVGTKVSDGTPFVIELDGGRKEKYECLEDVRVSEDLLVKKGGYVDGFCVVRGPLVYHGVAFDKYGGVHYNGCAFENGGYREEDADDDRRRYREVCIEDLVRKGVKGVEGVVEGVEGLGFEEVDEEKAKAMNLDDKIKQGDFETD